MSELRPDVLLCAYSVGIFPMANDQDRADVFWVEPRHRGVLPINGFRVPKRLARRMRRPDYSVTFNADFEGVVRACAESTVDRPRTWLNEELIEAYCVLARLGHAHSVEVYQEDRLVGGLYGVSMGAAFFGESMFSRATDMSKIALVSLVERLRERDYKLLDTQFMTPHLQRFGGEEIDRDAYRRKLREALMRNAVFA